MVVCSVLAERSGRRPLLLHVSQHSSLNSHASLHTRLSAHVVHTLTIHFGWERIALMLFPFYQHPVTCDHVTSTLLSVTLTTGMLVYTTLCMAAWHSLTAVWVEFLLLLMVTRTTER